MLTTKAHVPTASGSKYLQQLCKHWSHKLEVEFSEREGVVRFPTATARMQAGPEGLDVSVEAADAETLERMKDVMATHLDRFAFREAPLPFDWSA